MVNDFNFFGSQSLLKGKVVFEPEYEVQELVEYENNPFIEALPALFDESEVIKQFTIYPHIADDDRKKRTVARYHMIKRLKNFVQPLEIHLDIERKLSAIIRQGYLARNPYSKEFFQRLQLLNRLKETEQDNLPEKFEELNETLRSTAASMSIIGISGIGKTTAMERLLLMYPQVIVHGEYKNRALTRTQIVWLKIDCPYDGSLKTLCKIFFKAVDDVLGTTRYFEKYGNNRNSAATMMMHMIYVSTVHAIGVLVIDELQHLINPKNNPDEMLNYFVTLTNTIGVPTVLVGTFKALKVLRKDFRQARRASSEGNIIWDRMPKDEEWDFFLETMWQFQWLENYTELTDDLNNLMYYESQGITAIAVILFVLAQERALEKSEKITLDIIGQVVKNDLKMVQKMIRALRSNDFEEIAKYDDISISLDEILRNMKSKTELKGKIKELAKQQKEIIEAGKSNMKEIILSNLVGMNTFKSFKYEVLESIIDLVIKNVDVDTSVAVIEREVLKVAMEKVVENDLNESQENPKRVRANKFMQDDLRSIFNKSKREKRHIYEFLTEEGFIKNPLTEFH